MKLVNLKRLEDIQKLKSCYKQASQEFIQKLILLKQKVAEEVKIKDKAHQDLSLVMCQNAELNEKVNALLLKTRNLQTQLESNQ